ncbi:hypothetical protein GF339_02275 [candidate division KSB3 bacterium]|uniref:Uncharacterized protein n=1 Tax=candidate division KSB3 bacterium TaxID=2044937 RepID=A0A9D5JSD5_9BACT|nr:hypothetical protein [candidate division KSB3 bacterium]MBD3323379.1 hypothetical protein [candidate division KSB3 bacterium]
MNGQSPERSLYPTLLVLLLLISGTLKALLVFQATAHDPDSMFSPDSASYIQTAHAFLQTGHFAISPAHPHVPQIARTPGYPLVLATVFF